MKLMSYNVQTGIPAPTRVAHMLNNIINADPDIVGTQEVNPRWLHIFEGVDLFKEYGMIGKPRHKEWDHSDGNEYTAILYKKALYDVIYSDTCWLSDKPHKVSKCEGTDYVRIMTYAIFERKTDKKKFMHINTHIDCNSMVNTKQVHIMLELVNAVKADHGLEDIPTFFTGDFNMTCSWEGYELMTENNDDAKLIAAESIEAVPANRVIDFVFFSKNDFNVAKYDMSQCEGSDHFPIILDVDFAK